MRGYFISLTAVTAILLSVAAVEGAPLATSTFDTSGENWRLVSTLGHNAPVTWTATGGHPGGFIYGQDPDTGAFGFAAPIKFRGDKRAAYGQLLSFDVAAYQTPDTSLSWVGISGAGYEFVCNYSAPTASYPTWYSRSVTLHENAGWFDPDTSQPPTHAQMLAVLGNLDGLVIAAEFVEGLQADVSGLDNVVLMPEPASLMLLAVSLGLFANRRNRRQSFFAG